jgi:hypothetical protein
MESMYSGGRRLNSSEQISDLASALAKAQAKIEGASKDKLNPHFRSKYADLASVVEAIKGPITEQGLAYTQILHDAELAAKVETVILHSSGQWLSCGVIAVPVVKNDAQGYGSALTYARRYSLSAAFGVAPEDDDGNAAAAASPAKQIIAANVKPTAGAMERLDPEQRKKVEKVASEVVDCFEVSEHETAYTVIQEAKLDADEKVALSSLLGSGIRSALKRIGEQRRNAEAAAQA